MNKICSFLIIIIIIYLTYDYCSRITEGLTVAEDMEERKQERAKEDAVAEVRPCVGKKLKTIDKKSTNTKACVYENLSCMNAMNEHKAHDWESWNSHDGTDKLKKQCNLCVQGSKVDGNTRYVLANVSKTKEGVPHESHFADDLCDAMVAGCDSQVFYANNRQDGWNYDCKYANSSKSSWTDNKLNKAICKMLSNSIIQFFLGFMGGLECTLKIKGYQLESGIKNSVKCDTCCIAGNFHTTEGSRNAAKAKCANTIHGCKCS